MLGNIVHHAKPPSEAEYIDHLVTFSNIPFHTLFAEDLEIAALVGGCRSDLSVTN